VLVVEDGSATARVVEAALGRGAYAVRTAAGAAGVGALLEAWRPHLVVADADAAGGRIAGMVGTGPTGGARLPLITLTRRRDLATRLEAFARGADDVLLVPFSPAELLARVTAVARRSYGAAAGAWTPAVAVGELEVDLARRRVRLGGCELRLTPLQQSLLYLLAANAGRVVTRDEILDALWGPDYAAESNVVERHVRDLRTQLGDDWRRPRFIATAPGRGYRFLPASAAPPARPSTGAPATETA
jgi:DNA-binding response OmpR family regulator